MQHQKLEWMEHQRQVQGWQLGQMQQSWLQEQEV
jgi:hypothetical protein